MKKTFYIYTLYNLNEKPRPMQHFIGEFQKFFARFTLALAILARAHADLRAKKATSSKGVADDFEDSIIYF